MKTTEIVGYNREDLGTKSSKALRADGNVPCVLYGGDEVIHFHAPMILFKDLLYTPEAHIALLNIEGKEKRAVLRDVQFHPVSDMVLHCDFLEVFENKAVSLEVPVRLTGNAPGAMEGGQVYIKQKKLVVQAIPSLLPEAVTIDVSTLKLGSAIRVRDIETEDFEILNNRNVAIVQIIIPRALRQTVGVDAEGEEEGEEGEGEEAPAEGASEE